MIESGGIEIGEEFFFIIGFMLGKFLVEVSLRGILFSKVVWLWRFCCGVDKWYLNFIKLGFEFLDVFGISWYFNFFLLCDNGLFFGCDRRLVIMFIVEFDKLISIIVILFCGK